MIQMTSEFPEKAESERTAYTMDKKTMVATECCPKSTWVLSTLTATESEVPLNKTYTTDIDTIVN